MAANEEHDVIPLHGDSGRPDSATMGPSVTPDPVPSDDLVMKLSLAAAGGAMLGSLIVYRWLSRRIVVKRRD